MLGTKSSGAADLRITVPSTHFLRGEDRRFIHQGCLQLAYKQLDGQESFTLFIGFPQTNFSTLLETFLKRFESLLQKLFKWVSFQPQTTETAVDIGVARKPAVGFRVAS